MFYDLSKINKDEIFEFKIERRKKYMLTEREKKAIEIFNNVANHLNKYNKTLTIVPEDKIYFYTVLNLITNSQDEIIKLLKENRKLTAITNKYEVYEIPFTEKEDKIIIASKKYFANGFFKNNFISKALIERKINEYEYLINDFEITDNSGRFKKENSINYYKLEVLKELLKESESNE